MTAAAGGYPLGHLPGIPLGTTFDSRQEAYERGVHRKNQDGIVGTAERGAESIVVSGGYEDVDEGSVIFYTGHGGREGQRQVRDQTFDDPGNAALVTSMERQTPVRVIRGSGNLRHSDYGPDTGYRYDGIFRVDDYGYAVGRDGFRICQFHMVAYGGVDSFVDPGPFSLSSVMHHPAPGVLRPQRRAAIVQRMIRSTKVAANVKKIHDHRCQICRERLMIGVSGYSEGAHIQALGGLHEGPDFEENVLCLCPNCHVLFDAGAIIIQDDFSITRNGKPVEPLHREPGHEVDVKYIAYHRNLHTKPRK